ncbi:MAG: histidine kinase [Sphaerochaetaceae bacterium]
MKLWRNMFIREKILFISLSVLLITVGFLSILWYRQAQTNARTYLETIANSYVDDANSSLNYILTDTFHMLTLITLNEDSIIDPVQAIDLIELDENGQLGMKYLENQRKIMDFIKTMNGYKYYIVGIQVFSRNGHLFQTSTLLKDNDRLLNEIKNSDSQSLSRSMIMLEPVKVEGTWTKLHSDYVIPAVRAILDNRHETIGYVALFFDYSLFEQMFSANLPEGSLCRIIDRKGQMVFTNCTEDAFLSAPFGKYIIQQSSFDNVDWSLQIALPTTSLMKNINLTLRTTILWIVFVVIVSIILMILFVSNITKRISKLNSAMMRVAGGEFLSLGDPAENDEIANMQRTFNDMVNEIHSLMGKVASEEREKAKQQFKLLQTQINPHFISNTFNIITWMAKKQHADNIVPIADSMNSLLRVILKNDQELVPLREELDQVQSYINIMLCSGNYDFSFVVDVPGQLQDLLVLKFILQPIVENSLLHGFFQAELMTDQILSLSVYKEGKFLIIKIRDNGVGMGPDEIEKLSCVPKEKNKGLSGVGVYNVQQRIHLEYGDGYGLHYTSEIGKYTEAIFHLKIIEKEEKTGQ